MMNIDISAPAHVQQVTVVCLVSSEVNIGLKALICHWFSSRYVVLTFSLDPKVQWRGFKNMKSCQDKCMNSSFSHTPHPNTALHFLFIPSDISGLSRVIWNWINRWLQWRLSSSERGGGGSLKPEDVPPPQPLLESSSTLFSALSPFALSSVLP